METETLEIKSERHYLPEQINLADWKELLPILTELKQRNIDSVAQLEQWLLDRSELDAALEENLAWKYIKMNIDTRDAALAEAFNQFINDISPKVDVYSNDLNQKLLSSPYFDKLNTEKYFVFLRSLKKEAQMFREVNVAIKAKLATESQKYGTIQAALEIEHKGKKMTMQKASMLLKDSDRNERKVVFDKIIAKRMEVATQQDELLNELIAMRHQMAINAGYSNYRDFCFDELGRFDYTIADCEAFHKSVNEFVVPVVVEINNAKKAKLGLDNIKPYDNEAEPIGQKALSPFTSGAEMLDKSITCLNRTDPYFGHCIATMQEMGHLSLDSQPGKAPGGFNYPLYETGVPFIYTNNVGSQRDLVTFVHEAGHAVHSFLTHKLELTNFKSTPSEVAELASMSMELITMENWDVFYENPTDLNRAKIEQLEKIVTGLVWIAVIDKFQHWLYLNPSHTVAERNTYWLEINQITKDIVDWSDYPEYNATRWQNQLHIYEVPFYYIEYGFAQLGALAVWQNSRTNSVKAIESYKKALTLGYTKTIPQIYEAAGVKFDFSGENIQKLMKVVKEELSFLRGKQ